jgi:two-component system, sensor histidine kinase and response regulator
MNPDTLILVVEDEIALCQSLKIIIETLGVRVMEAINGMTALDILAHNKVDLIICDINLPDISGYEILKSVRADPSHNGVPFVFLTAFADEKDIREGYLLGANAYITKPFSARSLLRKLTEILDGN